MTAVKTILASGAALAALSFATPASAQYFPGSGYGGGDIIGQVIGSVIGGGSRYGGSYGSPYGYGGGYSGGYGGGYGSPYGGGYGSGYGSPYGNGGNSGINQYAVGQCMGAVQQKLSASYGQSQYGGGARVLGVSDVQRRNNGGTLVSGVANSGRTGANGYNGYNGGQPPVDLTFTCKTDASGRIASIDLGQATASGYGGYGGYDGYNGGYGGVPTTAPYVGDYSQYGYRRY